jgi:hypothetical protein
VDRKSRAFLVPIYPDYHTSLLPDSILKTESPLNFIEHQPHRNAIRKVYVGRSRFKELRTSDTLVFYRTVGLHRSVLTTLGIVEEVFRDIRNGEQFVRLCRKRSVFTDDELRAQWNWNRHDRPFITSFLYAYSFPNRPNLRKLIEHAVIKDINSAPRGFEAITPAQFSTILSLTQTDPHLVVN